MPGTPAEVVWASASEHPRRMVTRPQRPGRQPRCPFGCGKAKTHYGVVQSGPHRVAMVSGCEWHTRVWVRDGHVRRSA